ncbi:MAG: 4Fe-4S dicluster domain-containing protein [Acidimicrobiia bacterium]|nr:4Fe-4S dicluster domain-containing protein [Acidimicrobiia bacterium]
MSEAGQGHRYFLARHRLADLIDVLRGAGGRARTVIGPTVEQGAIVYAEIDTAADLPVGWRDEQAPGHYRLRREGDERAFAYAVGPTAWKRHLFPPARVRMEVAAEPGADGTRFEPTQPAASATVLLGARGCELAAMRVQDRVFRGGPYVDDHYADARDAAFVVAVQCTHPASTCFCTSMRSGPGVEAGYDLRLTEIADGFVVEAGTDAGGEVLVSLRLDPADEERAGEAHAAVAACAETVTHRNRGVDPIRARDLDMYPEHPRWDEVAARCLACTNCTMVCPTCFCSRDVQQSVLARPDGTVERQWDSCFTAEFAAVAGGSFRSRIRDRYRQWLTHKFSTWWPQFGTPGCVGCGRCIVWCPVEIDVREEIAAIGTSAPESDAQDGGERRGDVDLGPQALTTSPGGVPEPPPRTGTVERVTTETSDTVTLRVRTPPGLEAQPGQFVLAAVPRVGAPPISVSRLEPGTLELTVRSVGPATAALCRLGPGDPLGLAGAYGRGWPIEAARGNDVIVVAGGIGLAPLRPVIDAVLADRDSYGDVSVYVGARTPDDMIYSAEIGTWEQRRDVTAARIVDRAGPDWLGPVGVVTQLFADTAREAASTVAFVCGPERMMQASVDALVDSGMRAESIWLTTERHMECGVGLCGHCQLGPYFVCRDGPVFTAAELGPYLGVEGI